MSNAFGELGYLVFRVHQHQAQEQLAPRELGTINHLGFTAYQILVCAVIHMELVTYREFSLTLKPFGAVCKFWVYSYPPKSPTFVKAQIILKSILWQHGLPGTATSEIDSSPPEV